MNMKSSKISAIMALVLVPSSALQSTMKASAVGELASETEATMNAAPCSEWDVSLACVNRATTCQGATCADSQAELCAEGLELRFYASKMKYNNLGGVGPKFGDPEIIHWQDVLTFNGQSVDAIAEDLGGQYGALNRDYTCRQGGNGWMGWTGKQFAGYFNGADGEKGPGQVGALHQGSFKLKFKFVYSGTQTPVTLPIFSMTFYDVDGGHEFAGSCDASNAIVNYPTTVQGDCDADCCNHAGGPNEVRSPSDYENLDLAAKEATITYVFKDKSEFVLDYRTNYDGRVFDFMGSVKVACKGTNACESGNSYTGTPYVYQAGEYHPICGLSFWDNNDGATAFCKKLGYSSGVVHKVNGQYTENSVGVKPWGTFSSSVGNCNAGQNVAIDIECQGALDNSTLLTCRPRPPTPEPTFAPTPVPPTAPPTAAPTAPPTAPPTEGGDVPQCTNCGSKPMECWEACGQTKGYCTACDSLGGRRGACCFKGGPTDPPAPPADQDPDECSTVDQDQFLYTGYHMCVLTNR